MDNKIMNVSIIILAAGESKRMHSTTPKVLYPLAGVPILERLLRTAKMLEASEIYVVYNERGNQVCESLEDYDVIWVKQPRLLGTGHAVMQTLDQLSDDHRALVLYGDVPLVSHETLKQLIAQTPEDTIGWLTAYTTDPFGLGRILRDKYGEPHGIVEEKDATDAQKKISEINTGICLIPVKYLRSWLPRLENKNAQKEYYLTDIFAIARQNGVKINTVLSQIETDFLSVNDHIQLAYLERVLQKQIAEQYMREGLRLLDPNRFDIRGYLTFAQDVTIDINVVIEGEVSIGSNCYIGPNVYLRDVIIGNDVEIRANSVIEDTVISRGCVIGPFARIRPGTRLKPNVKIGNFVEVKKSEIGEGTKASHLGYIGDATIGKYVNIGAGTVTCNYDGVNKYQTVIDDEAFIGSNATLVPPVRIQKESYIGAGSTITEDTPEKKLTIARSRQVAVENWIAPKQKVKKEQECE
jgi:bifunctional UDP-N-acetylglucosamine pyrophosphorylase/glucosamine-1-phosphate N-acetyltransferase